MSREEKKYNDLMGSAPAASGSSATAQAAAELAAAEQAAQNIDYSRTADGRLDRAINDALSKSGFKYDVSKDKAYQDFAREYSQNALRGREAAQNTANQLSGGWTPTYAGTVGNEVLNDNLTHIANYSPSFRAAAAQEAADSAAQSMNTAQIYGAMADTDYSRKREAVNDAKNFVNYLASRYSNEAQNDIQRQGIEGDIWRSRLQGAANDLSDTRQIENAQYLLNTQSAANRAKLDEDAYEFSQKQAYTAAEDAYKDRVAAEKAAAKAAAAEQKSIDKAKKEYGTIADKIYDHLYNNKNLKYTELSDYDFNHNGEIDEYDLQYAKDYHETGSAQIEPVIDDRVWSIINQVNRELNFDKTMNLKERLDEITSSYKFSKKDDEGNIPKDENGKPILGGKLSDNQRAGLYEWFYSKGYFK